MNVLEMMLATWAPHTCVGCGRDGRLLCQNCTTTLPRAASGCYRCQSGNSFLTCALCRPHTPLQAACGWTPYDGLAKELVGALKFKYARAAADEMADLMAPAFERLLRLPDTLLVPVPTATRRVRERGYDQAVLLARALARRYPAPCVTALERIGQSQQHGASRQERWSGLGRSYRVYRPSRLARKRIILIDDVLTTGATFESAAIALRAAGVGSVIGLAFARAGLADDQVAR